MEEYIKLSDVLNNIEDLKKSPWYNDDNGFGSRIVKKDTVDIIRDLCVLEVPAADVKEVVHGKWLINCDGYYPYCSVCTEEPKGGNMTKYCPNCGAKMDLK